MLKLTVTKSSIAELIVGYIIIVCRDVTENIDRQEPRGEAKKSRRDEVEEAEQLMLRRRWARWKGLITNPGCASSG